MKEVKGEASCASSLPPRPRSKDWKPPAIPQPGIPTGRGCHRQGLRLHCTAMSFASSRPAARRGREPRWHLEEQIKAMTDELWQEQPWQLPSLLAEKWFPQQLSCLGLNPTHRQFGHQCQDQVVQLPLGQWGRGAMQNTCKQLGQTWSAKTFYSRLTALSIAAVITPPWSPCRQGEPRVGVNGP